MLVPHAAVSRTPRGEAQVMVVNAENTVEARTVKAEQSIGAKWVVTEGLTAGDRVIVEGLQKVKPGAPVTPKPSRFATTPPAPASGSS